MTTTAQTQIDQRWSLYHYVNEKPLLIRWILIKCLNPWFKAANANQMGLGEGDSQRYNTHPEW